jgi:hypothetical protein
MKSLGLSVAFIMVTVGFSFFLEEDFKGDPFIFFGTSTSPSGCFSTSSKSLLLPS